MVVPEALDQEIENVVAVLFAAGPRAVRLQKQLMRAWGNLPADRAIAAGIDTFVQAFETDEPRRMLSAFTNRKRDFRGDERKGSSALHPL